MSYIKKNTEPLINLKLTDLGRKNLANGKLSFETFQLGDSEIDYSSSDLVGLNILRPVDNQHDIQYPISPDGNNSKIPISNIKIRIALKLLFFEKGFKEFKSKLDKLSEFIISLIIILLLEKG